MKRTTVFLLLSGLLAFTELQAQNVMWKKMNSTTVCYGSHHEHNFSVPPPREYDATLNNARTKTATFNVTYIGFSTEARTAFQKAVDIWSAILTSPVIINVTAQWTPLGANVLGQAGAGTFHANFDGAQQVNTFYPAALAEKMAGQELNATTDADISASFNSTFNWSFNTDPNVSTPGQHSLVTVVLHELGHGLGFLDFYNVTNGTGSNGGPVPYDLNIENGSGSNLFINFASPSTQLGTQLTSNNLFYRSPGVVLANGNSPAEIYAPATFNGGSSIAHIGESFNNTSHALMTFNISANERIFDPGTIVKAMFDDMGWEFTYINHTRLRDAESAAGPFVVNAVITSDAGAVSSPKLVYVINGTETEVLMTPTGTSNQYTATIPTTNVPTTYNYYIKVSDADNRTITEPGKLTTFQTGQQQTYFTFITGPDMQGPKIVHSPKSLLLDSDTEYTVLARISDNIGIASAVIEYSLNDIAQTPVNLVLQSPQRDSIYKAVLNIASLSHDQKLKYRIVVTDNSSSTNQSLSPLTGFYELNTIGLLPPQEEYINDFSAASADFFNDTNNGIEGFSVATPTGFSNAALHTTHPYPEGSTFPANRFNYIHQLRVPILVKSAEANIQFEEIVLVEPGEAGSVFGTEAFFDYVVTEGSKDGGLTWIPIADGYDSRDQAVWLTRYNSATSGNNSTAVGDPSLYKIRNLNLLNKFAAGDQVLIRFRLYSDPGAAGWGWAIDNLKIQSDIIPPVVLHNHLDVLTQGNTLPGLRFVTSDNEQIDLLTLYYQKNSETEQSINATNAEDFTFVIPSLALAAGDILKYKVVAKDAAGNETALPSAEYFTVTVLSNQNPVSSYATDFNTTSDFAGNFFSVSKPAGFANNALHSQHPYLNGFGLNGTSDFTSMLKKTITLDAGNPRMRFDEVAIVETQASGITFGNEAFNDYVIIEGSKDGGQTWLPFLDGYDATTQTVWTTAFQNGTTGTSSLFRQRIVDLLANGNFEDGDNVLIRFRLFANQSVTGWGWAIDNLYIQDPITAAEGPLSAQTLVYPNPTENELTIEVKTTASNKINIHLTATQGNTISNEMINVSGGEVKHTLLLEKLPVGLYLLKISDGKTSEVRKVIKIN